MNCYIVILWCFTVIGQFIIDDPDNVNTPEDSPLSQTFSFDLIDDAEGRFYTQDGQLKVEFIHWTFEIRVCFSSNLPIK